MDDGTQIASGDSQVKPEALHGKVEVDDTGISGVRAGLEGTGNSRTTVVMDFRSTTVLTSLGQK